jgi:hypothetical protein
MKGWRLAKGHWFVGVILLVFLSFLRAVPAQQTQPLTLDKILHKLQDNLVAYHRDIPSFLCDEHAVSKMVPGTRRQNTVTDSAFRIKRAMSADGKTTLTESRDIKTVDGHDAQGEDITGPAIFYGTFSGGPVIVSLSQTDCMRYRLRSIHSEKPNDPYIVEFTSKPASERSANCVLTEDGAGLVVIDPATMQVTHLEFTVPNHTIYEGGKTANGYIIPPIMGVWIASIDYAKVMLEGKTFWMPATIDGKMTGGLGPTVWSFNARYSNFHKLEVTSRILPADGPVAPAH